MTQTARKGINLINSTPDVHIMAFELMDYIQADPIQDTVIRETIEASINFTLMMARFEPEFVASITQKWLGENLEDEEWVHQGHNYCRNFINKCNQTIDKYNDVLNDPNVKEIVDEIRQKIESWDGDKNDLIARLQGLINGS